jgi:hypothetical protein
MIGVKWFINRFSTMTFPELIFRMRQLSQRLIDKYLRKGSFPTKRIAYQTRKILTADYIPVEPYDNFLYVFGSTVDFSREIDWHLDISSGNRFPSVYCRDLNTRTFPNRSAKHVWEINRFQFLTKVAVQFRQTRDKKYLKLFTDIIRSWIEHNPYLIGIGWYNNIDVSIRLITYFLSWEILEVDELRKTYKEFDEFIDEYWIPLIHLHCKHSYAHPSRFSSANNHAIAEYAGLYTAASKWSFKESGKWRSYAKKGLEKEILLQHSENGINREEAAGYIQFATDFFLVSYIVSENLKDLFSDRFKEMLKNICYYIFHFTDNNNTPPNYGDEDDGRAFLLENSPDSNNFNSLIISGALLFRDPVLKSKTKHLDTKNLILFGNHAKEVFESIPDITPVYKSKFYAREGHFFFKHADNMHKSVFLHFNAAPLGYLSIAAHGHADILSFQLNINNQPVLVDPGTYIYHSAPRWRDYFRSVAAHNTIVVDKADPAKMGGPMIWLDHYIPDIIETVFDNDMESVTASHNGYNGYGVKHTRKISFFKTNNRFIIEDKIDVMDDNEHLIEFPVHLHPEITKIERESNQYILYYASHHSVCIEFDPAFTSSMIKGQHEPLFGWYSKSFFMLEETNSILNSLVIKNSVCLRTEVIIN